MTETEFNFVKQARMMLTVTAVIGTLGLVILLAKDSSRFELMKDVIDLSYNEKKITLMRVFLAAYETFWLVAIAYGFWRLSKKVTEVASDDQLHKVEAFESKFMKFMIGILIISALATLLGPILAGSPPPQFTTNADTEQTIYVTAYQFGYSFSFNGINYTSDITLKQNVYYTFALETSDTTHGFGIYTPEGVFLLQAQIVPNYTTNLAFTFEETGVYEIRCMEYCGLGHHAMVQQILVEA